MEFGFTTAAYVIATVLFILSLGGLSGQESAKRAVWYGIVGMALAVVATLVGPGSGLWLLSILLIAGGGMIGYYVAQKVQMTEMPQLVAAMHSLVGLAAVFVGFIAHLELSNVQAMTAEARAGLDGFAGLLAHKSPVEQSILRVELFLGIFIGAVTFTGSVIAYGKLAGKVGSAATKLPGGHGLNAGAALLSVVCLIWYFNSGAMLPLALMTIAALFIGYHLIMGIGGADMPVVVSMLNSYSGWAAAAIGFSLGNDLLIVVGALVGSSGAILSYIMCKAMNRSFVSVILGGFGGTSGPAMEVEGEQIAIEAEGVATALNEADIVVGYNHKGFDNKHAMREFITHGLGPPSPWLDVDLLKENRRLFKFASNRLGYVTEELDLPTKLDTGGQGLWLRVLDGDEAAWRKFKAYNVQDVRATEALAEMLWPYMRVPHQGLWSGNPKACPSCGGTDLTPMGKAYTKTTSNPRLLCACGAWCKVLASGQTRPI